MSDTKYPLAKFQFSVEWNNQEIGSSEVSGMDMEIEPIEYRDGADQSQTKIKMPGLKKYSNITLKRGTFKGMNSFFEWWDSLKFNIKNPKDSKRRPLTIKLLNEENKSIITWSVLNAWPLKVSSTDLKADGSEVAIETMEIAHEGISIKHEK